MSHVFGLTFFERKYSIDQLSCIAQEGHDEDLKMDAHYQPQKSADDYVSEELYAESCGTTSEDESSSASSQSQAEPWRTGTTLTI